MQQRYQATHQIWKYWKPAVYRWTGQAVIGFKADLGYGAKKTIMQIKTIHLVASAKAGLSSNFESLICMLCSSNLKLEIIKFTFTSLSTSTQWPHQITVSQGKEMECWLRSHLLRFITLLSH